MKASVFTPISTRDVNKRVKNWPLYENHILIYVDNSI